MRWTTSRIKSPPHICSVSGRCALNPEPQTPQHPNPTPACARADGGAPIPGLSRVGGCLWLWECPGGDPIVSPLDSPDITAHCLCHTAGLVVLLMLQCVTCCGARQDPEQLVQWTLPTSCLSASWIMQTRDATELILLKRQLAWFSARRWRAWVSAVPQVVGRRPKRNWLAPPLPNGKDV